jgi:serine phosphatase RsbU (regulator of sigma subunit)
VTGDFQRRGVRRALRRTFAELESFYLTDEHRQRMAAVPTRALWLRRIWWFIKGLLMKLTPARRIMLAAALILLVAGDQSIDSRSAHANISFPGVASLLLLSVLALELKDKLVARDELEAGRAVQLALMPGQAPNVPGWQVWLHTRPANDVGGLQIDARHHVVALGDVAGKALPAALLSVKLQATLRALAPAFDNLGDLGATVNDILHRDGLPSRFASLVYLVLTTDSGDVRLLNAGHMPPLLVRGTDVTRLPPGSMVLGLMPAMTFEEQSLALAPGDTMIVYSDGVSEAMNLAGDFFDDERVMEIARQTAGSPASAIGERMIAAVDDFVGEASPNDDISLIVLRRT